MHTGDVGYFDEEYFLFVADRRKGMIISGGENINPREVEEPLYTHPSVVKVAVRISNGNRRTAPWGIIQQNRTH